MGKLEEAAQHDGNVRYPVDFTNGWDAPILHANCCRVALSALELQAICYYQRGELSRAADKIIAVDYGTKESTLNGVSAHRTSRRTQNIQPVNIPAWMSGLQRFVRSKGVIIKSHAGIFYIGAGLPDEEVVYLHHLISQNLSINGV